MNPGFAYRYYLGEGVYELADNEGAVDLFCGDGGTSEGLTKAIGEGPAFAVNHNPDAIGVHAVNHPSTIHLESDVFAADPESYLSEKNIGLLVLSPSCTHFSAAKRSEEHTSELQSLMRAPYAVFCLKKKSKQQK